MKLLHEKILDELKEALKNCVEAYPEIDSLVVTINWKVGNNDFPAGAIIKKKDDQFLMESALTSLDQLRKMFNFIATNFVEAPLLTYVSELENKLKKLKAGDQIDN